ncbi:MAG: outer membrane lipoprotein-sorting protein [Nevskia sp.]|nr:outer membrane lipoprotein-sorting protein [Nevskia sp.]
MSSTGPRGLRLAALCCVCLAWPVQAARDEAALRACLAANASAASFAQDITITQTDANGAIKRLSGRWYWRRGTPDQQAMLKLAAPADLAGAAYLFLCKSGREAFYLYLPSLRKVRKVVGATVAQSLFGSGLSAFDLKFLFSGLSGGQFSYVGPDQVGGRSGERWRYVPPSDPDILYERADLVIDDLWCLPAKAELYGGVPWKTLTIDPASVSQVDGRWRAGRVLMQDLREGSRSEIRLGTEQTGQSLPAALFDPTRFYRQP